MSYKIVKSGDYRERRNFSRIRNSYELKDLLEIQKKSYNWFVEKGIKEVFEDLFPVENFSGTLSLEFGDYHFDEPKYSIKESKDRESTYSAPLRVDVRLFNRETGEVKEQEIFMGDMPIMTDSGTFVINGAERVIVSQLVRSPSVYFNHEIDKNGNTVKSDLYESVIRSKKQMTYKCVNKILEENIVPDGYEEYETKLREMYELAQVLRKNKVNRGYIDFDIDESKIIVDEKGEAIDVVLRERGCGEKLIEDFMIAANEAVATTIFYMDLPFVYRVHGEPNEEKINTFLNFVSILGHSVHKMKKITPKAMQELLGELKNVKEYPILSSLLLRSMQKAVYDSNNIGHFGLASKCYTHFTSPIRRYPDTTVHRLLRTYLFNKNININNDKIFKI